MLYRIRIGGKLAFLAGFVDDRLDVACFARSIGGKAGAVHPCRNCHGTGVKVSYRQLGPGMVQQMQGVCSDCHGEGMTYFCFRIDIYV